jgi:hypothetical protein
MLRSAVEMSGNKHVLAEALNALDVAHYRQIMSVGGNIFEQPAAYFGRALATGERAEYDHGVGVSLLNPAYDLAQATGNRRAALQTAFSIGEVHEKQKDRSQARRWYEQARA